MSGTFLTIKFFTGRAENTCQTLSARAGREVFKELLWYEEVMDFSSSLFFTPELCVRCLGIFLTTKFFTGWAGKTFPPLSAQSIEYEEVMEILLLVLFYLFLYRT